METRLKRLADGSIDATFLALAGLTRLGLQQHVTSLIDSDDMPPAPGQGALAITCREEDSAARQALARLSIPECEIAVAAERGFLEALDGSCRTPIGALAHMSADRLTLLGEVLSPDGARRWRRSDTLAAPTMTDAAALGRKLGAAIRAEAGETFIQSLDKRGW